MDTKKEKAIDLQENKAAKEDLNEAPVLDHTGHKEGLEQRIDNKAFHTNKFHSLSLIFPAKPFSISDIFNHSHDCLCSFPFPVFLFLFFTFFCG
jgi:hypothetical protein